MKRRVRKAGGAIISGFLAPTLWGVGVANAQDQDAKPHSRAEAVEVVRGLRHVVTPNGIERSLTVVIGNIPQAVTIRGDNLDNPILLVIHGGPGYVETPLSWWYARGWESTSP